jgi:hypothetical protein
VTILEVRVNDQVHDDLFRFQPLPGSVQSFADERMEQVVPGGTDYLDEVTSWSKRQLDGPATSEETAGAVYEAAIEYSVIVAGLAILIALAVRRRQGFYS